MPDYLIPESEASAEIDVKKSQFIAYAKRTQGITEAKSFIHHLREKYPDARHHCYAYLAGSPADSNQYGFSDDNEPSGTAGMPIFTHLKHSGLGEVTLVVVRYFGGTKLGTGGLARAYGDAAKAVLQVLPTQTHVAMRTQFLTMDFSREAEVRKKIEKVKGTIKTVNYGQQVEMEVEIPESGELTLPYSVSCTSKSTM